MPTSLVWARVHVIVDFVLVLFHLAHPQSEKAGWSYSIQGGGFDNERPTGVTSDMRSCRGVRYVWAQSGPTPCQDGDGPTDRKPVHALRIAVKRERDNGGPAANDVSSSKVLGLYRKRSGGMRPR